MTAPAAKQGRLLGVDRTLSVLTALAAHPTGLTLKGLQGEVGIPMPTLHRLLGVLEARGWASRSPSTKRYTVGPEARRLATSTVPGDEHAPALAPLVEAGRATGETVFMTRMVDERIVCVALVEAVHPLRLFVRHGQEMPMHAAASARAILAFHDLDLVERLLTATPRQAFTPATMREVNRVIDHLDVVRQRGFDVSVDELDDGVWAFGAPVFDELGRVEAAVTLAAAASRMEGERTRIDAAATIVRTAESLSASIDPPRERPSPDDVREAIVQAGI